MTGAQAASAPSPQYGGVIPVTPTAITLDTVYAKEPLWGRMFARVSWSPDGERFLYVRPSQDPSENLPLMLYDVARGTSQVWMKANAFPETPQVLGWSPAGTRVILLVAGNLYVSDIARGDRTEVAADVDDAQWSPRGDAVAYAHGADLYVASLGKKVTPRRITRGGVPSEKLNATLDWVYPEELGIRYAFRWSPDAMQIAYLTMDERRVTNFPIVDFLTTNNAVTYGRYPLAGQANPGVTLRVVSLKAGADRLVYDARTHDEYVAAFDWVPRTNSLVAEILDRPQRTMRVELWRDSHASPVRLYDQSSPSWVDVQPLPFWLADGRSIWLLDREKTAGVYLRQSNGSLRKLTGNYRVTDLLGVSRDETVYLQAAYPTRRDRSVLAISLAGVVRNLTPEPGAHAPTISQTFTHFVDLYSRANDPPRTGLVDVASGNTTDLVPENMMLKAALLPTKMLEVPSEYGPLDATEIDPSNFTASQKWPVVMY
ncbi:MAG: DPP IV N-terminal domain-containing protein, partial [Candidatus Cybelea sp.]